MNYLITDREQRNGAERVSMRQVAAPSLQDAIDEALIGLDPHADYTVCSGGGHAAIAAPAHVIEIDVT
jgi:hypothetical protein